jgi:uncharacterized protein YcnI
MRVVAAIAVALALSAVPAAAHVDVLPAEVPAGEASELTVRVPTERDVPTTAVRLEIPAGVTVFSVGVPPPGWSVRVVQGSDGVAKAVVWSGGRIGVGRHQDFTLLATPSEPGATLWPSFQTYGDGIVKPWTTAPVADDEPLVETGPADPGPAAVLDVLPPGEVAAASAPAAAGDDGDSSGAAVWLGLVAIAIAALAALGVGLLWSSRPARLPPEEPEA